MSRKPSTSRSRHAARISQAALEPLEQRVMLDGAGPVDFPALLPLGPAGGLIYQQTQSGDIGLVGEVDQYRLNADAGQSLTVLLEPAAALRGQLALTGPGLSRVVSASAAGENLLIQCEPAATGGEYLIDVSGLLGSTGGYTVQVVLNAAIEEEEAVGTGNNSLGWAQDLDRAFLALEGASARSAVIGAAVAGEPDWYSLDLAAMDHADLRLLSLSGSGHSLRLYDAGGMPLSPGLPAGQELRITDLVSPSGARYYVEVGGEGSYSLVVGRNAALEAEPIPLFQPQDLATRAALGALVEGFVPPAGTGTLRTGAWDLSGTPLSAGFAADGSFVGNSIGIRHGSIEYLRWGTYCATYTVSYNGINYHNGAPAYSSAFPVVMYDISSGPLHAARITGAPSAGVAMERVVWWMDGWDYVLVNMTLTNNTALPLNNVAWLENHDPDPDNVTSTRNDVLTANELVASWNASGAMAMGSRDSRAVVSAEGFQVTAPFEVINSPVDPNGADSDIAINLAFNVGTLLPGASASTTMALVFGADTAALQATWSSIADLTARGDMDVWRVYARAGDTLSIRTLTPGGGGGEFVNDLDPLVELWDASNTIVASNDNGPDGRNAGLSYAVVADGYYSAVVRSAAGSGEYVLLVSGQSGLTEPFRVVTTTPASGTHMESQPLTITVDFNRAVLLPSLWASGLLVDGTSVSTTMVVDADTLMFGLPPDLAEGVHTVSIQAGSILSLQSTPVDLFEGTFDIDSLPPHVIFSSIQPGDVVDVPDVDIVVVFDEPLMAGQLDSTDVSLTGGISGSRTPASVSYDAGTSTLTVRYTALAEDLYTFRLLSGDGRFEDTLGHDLDGEGLSWPIPPNRSGDGVAGGDLAVGFAVEGPALPLPWPMPPVSARAPLAYSSSVSAAVSYAGDSDDFALDLLGGQLLSVSVAPGVGLQPRVEIHGPTGLLASATGLGAGQGAVVNAMALAEEGVYTITVSGVWGVGTYTCTAYLNADVELEWQAGGSDNTRGTAQDVDGGMLDVGGGGSRAVVVGQAVSGDPDWYGVTVSSATVLNVELAGLGAGEAHVRLVNAAGQVLAQGKVMGGTNESINGYLAVPGRYYVVVTGTAKYALTVLRGATLEKAAHSTTATAQEITVAGAVLGQAASSLGRLYVYDADYEKVRELDPVTGAVIREFTPPVLESSGPDYGMATTGGSLLVGGYDSPSRIHELDPDTGGTIRSLALPSAIEVSGLAFLNDEIFVQTDSSGSVVVLDYGTGAVKRTIVTSGISEGLGASDTTLYGVSGSTLYRVDPATGQTSSVGTLSQGGGEGIGVIGGELFVAVDTGVDVYDLGTLTWKRRLTNGSELEAVGADGGSGADYYAVNAVSGDALRIQTYTPVLGGGTVRNEADPELELYDPDGALVASDSSGGGGVNALITHTAGETGRYVIRLSNAVASRGGPYTLSVTGQTGPAPEFTVVSVSPADGTRLSSLPAVTVELSGLALLPSLSPSDVSIDGVPLGALTTVDGDTLSFALAGLSEGPHTIAIADGSFTDLWGTPIRGMSWSLVYDLSGPRIVASSIQQNGTVSPGPLTYTARFDEPLKQSNLDVSDAVLTRGGGSIAASSITYDAATFTVTVQFPALVEDNYTLKFLSGDGRFEDPLGHDMDGEALSWPIPPERTGNGTRGGDFVVGFMVDAGVEPFPTPLTPAAPASSLVHRGSTHGVIGTSLDADGYTIWLDAGQVLSVVVRPDGVLQPTVWLEGPSGPVASAAAAAPGDRAIIQAAPVAGGDYTVTVSAPSGSQGGYTLELVLNAMVEMEPLGGTDNDDRSGAEAIDASALSLGPTATRLAVVGTMPSAPGLPVFTESFESGALPPGWTTWSSTGSGRIQFTGAWTEGDGAYAMWMDSSSGLALNEAVWTLNLAGVHQPTLRFSHAEYGDEEEAFSGAFDDHYEADGIAISEDGTRWYPVWSAPNQSDGVWNVYNIDLAAAAASAGIHLTSAFRIKFQQRDDNPLTTDGRGYDAVSITTPITPEDWYSLELLSGVPVTLAAESQAGTIAGMELYDATGSLLAVAGTGPTNVDRAIVAWVPPASGVHYVRMLGQQEYLLLVTRDATLDLEENDQTAPQDVTRAPTVLGGLGSETATVDADSYPEGTVLTDVIAGMRLSVTDSATVVRAVTSSYTSTGTRVFGRGTAADWSDGSSAMRVDFPRPVRSVTIDVVADDSSDQGFLRAYDASGDLIQEVVGAYISTGQNTVLTVTAATSRIAYVIAGGANGEAVMLDNLIVNVLAGGDDWYLVQVAAGDPVRIVTELAGQGGGEFGNDLDPAVELYDPDGGLVAGNDNGPDGRNVLLDHVAAATGNYLVRVRATDGGGPYVLKISGHTGGIAARVTGVGVRSTRWTGAFPGLPSGYALPTGAAQFAPLPWVSLDQILLGFSEDVSVAASDLSIVGVEGTYRVIDFQYDSGTLTACWTLAGLLDQPDRLLLQLSDEVTDSNNNRLDGEWTDGQTVPQSGDGRPGGEFRYRLNVLPGDVDQSGAVTVFDTIETRNLLFLQASSPDYRLTHDVDGNGVINILDLIRVRNQQFTELPDSEPAPILRGGTGQLVQAGSVPTVVAASALPAARQAASGVVGAIPPTLPVTGLKAAKVSPRRAARSAPPAPGDVLDVLTLPPLLVLRK